MTKRNTTLQQQIGTMKIQMKEQEAELKLYHDEKQRSNTEIKAYQEHQNWFQHE
jgi:hypothetical protein